jgi:CHAT domain-containing protein
MAVLALSRLLNVPLIDLTVPSVAILQVNRENGTIRVGFVPPGLGAIVPSERMKLSDSVRAELGLKQQEMLAAIGRTRSAGSRVDVAPSDLPMTEGVLRKAGQYTYGHLIPPRIQALLEGSTADHLRMDVDERLIDLPWELIHDGSDFLCMRYAAGRRLVSDQLSAADGIRHPRPVRDASALVIADPTADLPGAKKEGEEVSALLTRAGLRVDFLTGRDVKKRDVLMSLRQYDIVHYAGHATHDSLNPDESCLVANDGEIQAFEIARFLKAPCPSVVFLNACWSAEELRDPEAYSPMMRGLSRTFMYAGVTAFLGYLVPVPDRSAKSFAIEFYTSISVGRSIGESVRRSRIAVRESYGDGDVTWASAVLYGEPSAGVLIH